MTIRADGGVLVTSEDCFVVATFYIVLHAVAGGTLINNRHFASVPFSQIMDVRVAFYTVELTLCMMDTSQVFLRFLLMAGTAIDLRRYVDFLRMLFKIYDINMTAAARVGPMDGVCIFHPVDATSVAFQAIRCKKGSLHLDVDGHRSEFSKRR
jgi:hypothetical protein